MIFFFFNLFFKQEQSDVRQHSGRETERGKKNQRLATPVPSASLTLEQKRGRAPRLESRVHVNPRNSVYLTAPLRHPSLPSCLAGAGTGEFGN